MEHREKEILNLADEYCRLTGCGPTYLSYQIFNDSKKLKKLRKKGASLRQKTYEGAVRWFKENWHKTARTTKKRPKSQMTN